MKALSAAKPGTPDEFDPAAIVVTVTRHASCQGLDRYASLTERDFIVTRHRASRKAPFNSVQIYDADGRPLAEHRAAVIPLLGAAPPVPFRMVAKTLDLLAPSRLTW